MTVRLSTDDNLKKLETALLEAKKTAEQEYFNLQFAGREFSPDERKKAEMLELCLGYIREALTCLKQD